MGHKQIVLYSFLSVLPSILSFFFLLFLPVSLLASFHSSSRASFFPLLLLMLHLLFATFLFCFTLFLCFPVYFTSFLSLLSCFISFLLSSFPTLFSPCYPFPKPSHQWYISRLSFPFFLFCLLAFLALILCFSSLLFILSFFACLHVFLYFFLFPFFFIS